MFSNSSPTTATSTTTPTASTAPITPTGPLSRLFSSLFTITKDEENDFDSLTSDEQERLALLSAFDALANATLVEDRRTAMATISTASKTYPSLLYGAMVDWTSIIDVLHTDACADQAMTQYILDTIINLISCCDGDGGGVGADGAISKTESFPEPSPSIFMLPYEKVLLARNDFTSDSVSAIDYDLTTSADERSSDLLSVPGIHLKLLSPFLQADNPERSFCTSPTPLVFTLLQILLQLAQSNEWSLVNRVLLLDVVDTLTSTTTITTTNTTAKTVLEYFVVWLSKEKRPLIRDLLMELLVKIESPAIADLSYKSGLLTVLLSDTATFNSCPTSMRLLKKSLSSYEAMSFFITDDSLMAKFGKLLRSGNAFTSCSDIALTTFLDSMSPLLKQTQHSLVSGPSRILSPLLDDIFFSGSSSGGDSVGGGVRYNAQISPSSLRTPTSTSKTTFPLLTALFYRNSSILDILLRQQVTFSGKQGNFIGFLIDELFIESNADGGGHGVSTSDLLTFFEGFLKHKEMSEVLLIDLLSTSKALSFFSTLFTPSKGDHCLRLLRILTMIVGSGDGGGGTTTDANISILILCQTSIPISIGSSVKEDTNTECISNPSIEAGTPFIEGIFMALQFCLEESLLRDKEWDLYSIAYMRLLISMISASNGSITSSIVQWDDSMLLQRIMLLVSPPLNYCHHLSTTDATTTTSILPPSEWEEDVGMMATVLLVTLSVNRNDIYSMLLENCRVDLMIDRWIRRVLMLGLFSSSSSSSSEVRQWKRYCRIFFDKYVGFDGDLNDFINVNNNVNIKNVSVRIDKTKLFINDVAYRTDLALFKEPVEVVAVDAVVGTAIGTKKTEQDGENDFVKKNDSNRERSPLRNDNDNNNKEKGILSYIAAVQQKGAPSKETYDV